MFGAPRSLGSVEANVATLNPPVDHDRDHVRGPADAPVTLVEYGDFQCPYCGDAYPVVTALIARFGERLRFAFRHMPLGDIHPRAPAAARAAEAAAAQGRFWEMHDRLFEHQNELSDRQLRGHAEAIGLDLERFERDLTDPTIGRRVDEDYASGARSGVPSTPRFFVNNVIHLGSPSLNELEEAIELELG
jgi:NhaA family Na+:H+ antiporter